MDIDRENLDKDVALTVVQFVLNADIPEEERDNFKQFMIMFSKLAALSRIERRDIFKFLIVYNQVIILLDKGLYDIARELMGEYLMTLQLCRSINGFYTLYGQGIQRSENIQKTLESTTRRSSAGRLSRLFGGGRTNTEKYKLDENVGGM
jgi:hypothetical protein